MKKTRKLFAKIKMRTEHEREKECGGRADRERMEEGENSRYKRK